VLPDEVHEVRAAQGRYAHTAQRSKLRVLPATTPEQVAAIRREWQLQRAQLIYRAARRMLYALGEPPPDWDPATDRYLRAQLDIEAEADDAI
jgi:hypothetical protein